MIEKSEHLKEILADPEMTKLTKCKTKLFNSNKFLSQIAARMEFIESTEYATGATDGINLYWNRDFVKSLPMEELIFFLGHECLHILHGHVDRRGTRDPLFWNIAVDYQVNYTLVNEKIGKKIENIFYDKKYTDDMSSEEIYDLLIKNKQDTTKATLDTHIETQGDSSQQSKDEIEKKAQDIRSMVISAVQSCDAGDIPGGIKRLIEKLITPKLDWRSLLDSFIRSSVKEEYSFKTFGRRSWASEAIFPGQTFGTKIKILCAIDVSGSISQKMAESFLSECIGIASTFEEFEIDVVCFDTKVYNHQKYTQYNKDEVKDYEITGNGGTDYLCVERFILKIDETPEQLVMFTDGLPGGSWGNNVVETLFIINGNRGVKAPFGTTCYFD